MGPIPNLPLPRALGFAGERLGGFPFFLTPSFKIHPAVAGTQHCDPSAHGGDASLPASIWLLIVGAVSLARMLHSCSGMKAPRAS